jgi:hypothetical protein
VGDRWLKVADPGCSVSKKHYPRPSLPAWQIVRCDYYATYNVLKHATTTTTTNCTTALLLREGPAY